LKTQKVYVPEHVHQIMVECDYRGLTAVELAEPRKVGKNQMFIYELGPDQAVDVLDLLSTCMIEGDVNGKILDDCEKTITKFNLVKESESAPAETFQPVEESEAEKGGRFLADSVKKVSTKKAGGHIPPEWRKLDENSVELRDHLLSFVHISDRAWTKKGEVRGKGEKRADFIMRVFGERIG